MEDFADNLREFQAAAAAAVNEAAQAVVATVLGVELPGLRTLRKGEQNATTWFEPLEEPSHRDGIEGPPSLNRVTAAAAGVIAERAIRKIGGTLPGASRNPARDLVRRHWPAICRVAAMLMGRWGREGLSQADVAEIIRISPAPAFGEGL